MSIWFVRIFLSWSVIPFPTKQNISHTNQGVTGQLDLLPAWGKFQTTLSNVRPRSGGHLSSFVASTPNISCTPFSRSAVMISAASGYFEQHSSSVS